ncbi:thiamine phosphate synthase [bacterium]|nr:thiamine phosphate synthase [bacterium]
MKDTLKREFNKIKLLDKNLCIKVIVDDYETESELLDAVAIELEKDVRFFQLNQGLCADNEFLEVSQKVQQLTSMYDATLVVKGSLALSYFLKPDGVLLDNRDIDFEKVRELLGETIIIGYECVDEDDVKKAIKRGADYLVIPTPSTSTNNVVIEYAKWVYENVNKIPVFLEVDFLETHTKADSIKIDKHLLLINKHK